MEIKHNNKGFTLVELVVSMAVFAIATVAISSILVCAIRYSGLSFREEANLREVMTVERVLEAALNNATEIDALAPKYEADIRKWESLAVNTEHNFTEGMVLIRFKQEDETKVYEVLYKKNAGNEPTKLWYRIGSELSEVPANEDAINALGMTLLSDCISDIDITYTETTLDYQMTVKNQATEHNLHRFWNIGVEKTAAGAI